MATMTGCASLPTLHDVGTPAGKNEPSPPAVTDVIRHVECEIVKALSNSGDVDIKAFLDYDYIVYVSLTLDETVNEGLTPSLSYINPYATAGTNFTLSASGVLTGQQHRDFVESFSVDLDQNLAAAAAAGTCKTLDETSGIKGDLGLRQIIVEGARHRDPSSYVFPVLGDESNLDQQQKDAIGSISGQLLPTFATTVDFTLVYGVTGGGPSWTLTHFTGPTGTSGLVNYSKTFKNSILLSFATAQKHVKLDRLGPIDKSAMDEQRLAKVLAGQAAQANATRILLQHLRLVP
jgi:hypothetical protein